MCGKDFGKLCFANPRPMPHLTRIDMNETTTASGIIPNPARLAHQCTVAEPLNWDIGKLYVDCAAQDVFASVGDMPTDVLEQSIGLR
jgi:hypothetical protein